MLLTAAVLDATGVGLEEAVLVTLEAGAEERLEVEDAPLLVV